MKKSFLEENEEFCRECGKVYTHRRGCWHYEPDEMEELRSEKELAEFSAWMAELLEKECRSAIEWAEKTIAGIKEAGEVCLVGASTSTTYRGGYWSSEVNFNLNELPELLACGWQAAYSNEFTFEGRSHGSGASWAYYIGQIEICSRREIAEYGQEAENFYYTPSGRITKECYDELVAKIKVLFPKRKEDSVSAEVQELKRQGRIAQILRRMKTVESEEIGLGHIYGASYFGSGGAWGSVHSYDLAALHEGRFVEVPTVVISSGDNGFVSGISAVKIAPGTVVIAKGGDCVGYEGRSWEEIYVRQ